MLPAPKMFLLAPGKLFELTRRSDINIFDVNSFSDLFDVSLCWTLCLPRGCCNRNVVAAEEKRVGVKLCASRPPIQKLLAFEESVLCHTEL